MTVSITSANVADITKAVKAQLLNFPALENVAIVRGEDRALDPGSCPWAGVYRMEAQFKERVLGFGGGVRDQLVRILVLVSAADQGSGEACEDALEDLVASVVSALLSDTTLGGTVNTIGEFSVNYDYDKPENVYMQTAALQFVAVGNTTAQSS